LLPATLETSQIIAAPAAAVWQALTEPQLMQQWMAEPAVGMSIRTDWTVGSPVRVTGFHHIAFENTGYVLNYEPEKRLRYSQLSSISELPDIPSNYSIFDFQLSPTTEGTRITLQMSQFPTESIYKHLEFYWRVTLAIFKRFVERRGTGDMGLSPS
jgi:uncharacterized protein YndB with AHSA1/START domain